MSLRYVQPSSALPNASSGRDLLSSGAMIRPIIGGSRKRSKKGGFVPSVMEGFVSAAGRYVVPMAMYAGYKLVNRVSEKKQNRSRKNKKTKKSYRK